MNQFYDEFSPKPRSRGVHFWKGIILGLLVGGLLVATLFFYLAGDIFPPDLAENGQALPLLELDQDRALQMRNLSPEVQEYYMAVVRAAEEVTPSVVGISNFGIVIDFWGHSSLQERATGSGVIIDKKGYIVTNYHVIENARELVVTLSSGEELSATIVGADPPTDLAVLKVKKTDLPSAMLADSESLHVGEPALAIGNPLGLDFQQSVTLGVVSARKRSITIQGQKFTFIQTDAAINDGNSGGALVNIHGQVIGINTAKIKIPGVEGMGFAIPANTVKEITRALISQGKVERPWLGVYLSTLTAMDAQLFELQVQEGVLIRNIIAGGPADAAGLLPLDVIIAFDGTVISDSGQLQELICQASVGQKKEIVIMRGKEQRTIWVTLGEMPENLE